VGGSPEKRSSMDGEKEKIKAGMSAQTSSTTASIGGHVEEQSSLRVASGRAPEACYTKTKDAIPA